MASVVSETRSGLHRMAPVLAALTVSVLTALVAASGVMATSGGIDQRHYHWVTVQHFREMFPRLDVVNVRTATSPLYHLVVAAISGPLDLTESQTQFVASFFAAGLAAVATWYASSIPSRALRILAPAPLLLSPYFWQSALWMLTDAAALLFALSAFILLLRQQPKSSRSQLTIGVLLAAAVATRQTYVWALVPAVAVVLSTTPGSPLATRLQSAARIALPGLTVLVVLVALWRGFLPPGMHELNATRQSWVSVSYCFAVSAIFFVPVFLALPTRVTPRSSAAVVLGLVAALPALVFPSAATPRPDDARRGGLIWELVQHTPTLAGRSPLLALLAFIGACSVCHVLVNLDKVTATLVASSLAGLAVTMSAGGQLYQKYFELPIAALTLLAICALAERLILHRWPLVGLATLQAMLTAGIVIKPLVAAL
jgi:hypothetical protein